MEVDPGAIHTFGMAPGVSFLLAHLNLEGEGMLTLRLHRRSYVQPVLVLPPG